MRDKAVTKEQMVSFVRDTLGCQCPDDVFDDVSSEEPDSAGRLLNLLKSLDPEAADSVMRVISVGGKLIVIVSSLTEGSFIRRLLEAGVSVREAFGYNRLRLALVTGGSLESSEREILDGFDERVHLHVL
ncbi:MAG: hypothetical protein V3S63_04435 [bacterium]